MFPSPQPSPHRGEGADRANIRRGSRLCQYQERQLTVPISGEAADRANIRRGSRPCPYQEREPTVPVSGKAADRANIRRGSRPCQYQERQPTVPVSREAANRANVLWGSLSQRERENRPYSAIRITSSGWVASCWREDFCFTVTNRVLPSAESARLFGKVGVSRVLVTL